MIGHQLLWDCDVSSIILFIPFFQIYSLWLVHFGQLQIISDRHDKEVMKSLFFVFPRKMTNSDRHIRPPLKSLFVTPAQVWLDEVKNFQLVNDCRHLPVWSFITSWRLRRYHPRQVLLCFPLNDDTLRNAYGIPCNAPFGLTLPQVLYHVQ